MLERTGTPIAAFAAAACILIAAAAWAAKLEGDYLGTGNSFFEKLSFRPAGKVRITFMGTTKVGTYEIDGEEVLITVNNETNVFMLDADGCVDGGGLLGKYCKGGAASADGGKPAKSDRADKSAAVQSGAKAAALAGVYKAGNREMTIALDFKTADKVRVSVSGTQAKKESVDAVYKVTGDRVTISVPDGSPPLVLTRKGNTLEGAPQGESVKLKFVKQ